MCNKLHSRDVGLDVEVSCPLSWGGGGRDGGQNRSKATTKYCLQVLTTGVVYGEEWLEN